MMDFVDRYRKVKETIRESVSDYISHRIIFNIKKKGYERNGFNGVARPSGVIRRRQILNISYKLFDSEIKFNKKRMELLSSSERLFIIESILKELE